MKYIDLFFDYLEKRWRLFFLSFGLQLILTILLGLGIKAPLFLQRLSLNTLRVQSESLTSPSLSEKSVIQQLLPRLQQKQNNFSLFRSTGESIIPQAQAAGDFEFLKSYIVIDDGTGQILAEKNIHQQLPIASLTKLMTAVVSLDVTSPDQEFTITNQAAQMIPTKIGVVEGQRMSLDELLKGALLTSANDAAEAIKVGINNLYNRNIFISLMNEKAVVMGLKDTRFANPEGLDSINNYSSAADLAVLAHYAITNYPTIATDVKSDYQFLSADLNHKQFDLYNWNGLLGVYPGAYGVKIGNTDQAGFTSIVAAERGGKRILVVALGAPGVLQRDMWASELLDLGFQKFGIPPANITESQLEAKYATWKYWE